MNEYLIKNGIHAEANLQYLLAYHDTNLSKTKINVLSSRRILGIGLLIFALLITALALGNYWEYRKDKKQRLMASVDLATSLQVYSSSILSNSLYSIQGIENNIAAAMGNVKSAQLSALRVAMKFDPVSMALGVFTDKGVMMIDSMGELVDDPRFDDVVTHALRTRPSGNLVVLSAIKCAKSGNWYLPLVMHPTSNSRGVDAIFSLIPVVKFREAAAGSHLLPSSYIGFVTPDGRRLFQLESKTHDIRVINAPITQAGLNAINRIAGGSLEGVSSLDGRNTLYGISKSPKFPLYIAVATTEAEVVNIWLGGSLVRFAIALVASFFVAALACRLLIARQKDLRHVRLQAHMAIHDNLTGLLNRYAFGLQIQKEIKNANARRLAVVLISLSWFKEINDTLGRQAGDAALREFGRLLNAHYNCDASVAARLGGDEFVVCVDLMRCPDGVDGLLSHLKKLVETPISIESVSIELSAYMGASIFPDDAGGPEELLRYADLAMQMAKSEQRPNQRYFGELNNSPADSLLLKTEFSRALRSCELSLVYQPKFKVGSGHLYGVEALCRWSHSTLGQISPARFIPIAEATELIHPFTDFVMRTAVAQWAAWRDSGWIIPIAVNISTNNLMNRDFVELTRQLLQVHNVPAGQLEMEITESALMRNPHIALERMRELRTLGVHLAIDDFGTGYSSLAYLKKLPINTIKIDQSFINNLHEDAGNQRIVQSTIQLAHGFGMEVVAEGVETEEIAAFLRSIDCDVGQGYYFARPLSPQDLQTHWLLRV